MKEIYKNIYRTLLQRDRCLDCVNGEQYKCPFDRKCGRSWMTVEVCLFTTKYKCCDNDVIKATEMVIKEDMEQKEREEERIRKHYMSYIVTYQRPKNNDRPSIKFGNKTVKTQGEI